LFGQWFVELDQILHNRSKIERPAPVLDRTAFDKADLERGFQHGLQRIGIGARGLQRLDRVRLAGPRKRKVDRRRKPGDRRAQVMGQRARNRPELRNEHADPLRHEVHLLAQVIEPVSRPLNRNARAEVARSKLGGGLGDEMGAPADDKTDDQSAEQRHCDRQGNGETGRCGKGQIDAPLGQADHPDHQLLAIGQQAGERQPFARRLVGAAPHHHRLRAGRRRNGRHAHEIAEDRRPLADQRDEDGGIRRTAAARGDEPGQFLAPAIVVGGQQVVAHVDHLALVVEPHDVEHLSAQEQDDQHAREKLQHEDRGDQPQHGRRKAAAGHASRHDRTPQSAASR